MTLLTAPDRTRIRLLTYLGLVTLAGLLVRLALFDVGEGSGLYHPHGYCYLWQRDLVATHVVSDMLIGLSYVSISLTLIYLVRRARRHLPFSWMFVAFGAFIIACGATHFMEVWTLWSPVFWLSADVKIITAIASVVTAVLLPPLVPKVLGVVQEAAVSEERRRALEHARAELEERVDQRTRELREALQQAEAANRAKEAFLPTVSHELRTPLNAILGWSGMLQDRQDPAFVRHGLTVIDRNARRQAQLVEDMLDISRVTSGTLRLTVAPVALARVVEEAVDSAAPAAAAKGVQLSWSADAPELAVQGDARRLQQIAWNLIGNAVKFTPAGGQVRVRVRREEDSAVLDVQDTGIGLDTAYEPELFRPFSQQDPTPTRAFQGLGLGLAITKHLVELHGGTIAASSEGPGTGAIFRVRLPALTAPAADRSADPVSSDGAGPPVRLDAIRILLVDDEPDARETIALMLTQAGATVTTAGSADEALGLLHGERRFDLLLSDLAMPHDDGLELIRRIRSSSGARFRELPAVALTAYAREEDRSRALEAGFHSHVAKPVTSAQLLRALAAFV